MMEPVLTYNANRTVETTRAYLKRKTYPFQFGQDLIDIEIVPKNKSERILEIYININKETYNA